MYVCICRHGEGQASPLLSIVLETVLALNRADELLKSARIYSKHSDTPLPTLPTTETSSSSTATSSCDSKKEKDRDQEKPEKQAISSSSSSSSSSSGSSDGGGYASSLKSVPSLLHIQQPLAWEALPPPSLDISTQAERVVTFHFTSSLRPIHGGDLDDIDRFLFELQRDEGSELLAEEVEAGGTELFLTRLASSARSALLNRFGQGQHKRGLNESPSRSRQYLRASSALNSSTGGISGSTGSSSFNAQNKAQYNTVYVGYSDVFQAQGLTPNMGYRWRVKVIDTYTGAHSTWTEPKASLHVPRLRWSTYSKSPLSTSKNL